MQVQTPATTPVAPNSLLDPAIHAPLLRVREVMAITALSRAKVYALMAQGRFPRPVTLSARLVRWRRGDVESWLADPVGWGQREERQ